MLGQTAQHPGKSSIATSATQRYFAGLSRNTFLLAFSSLFADISIEMLYPVSWVWRDVKQKCHRFDCLKTIKHAVLAKLWFPE
jgi:hypothetical protein